MAIESRKTPSPLMWATSVAIVLFCGVGIAAFMGWLPTSLGNPSASAALPVVVSDVVSEEKPPVHKSHRHVAKAESQSNSQSNRSSNVTCTDCGVIESVRVIKVDRKPSGIGLVGGAVVGGLLGNQVGGGRGKDVATVAGAVGGAVAGNEIEENTGSTKRYEITVRFENGSSRVFNESNPPAWQSGDHVRVVDGAIRSNG